MLPVALQKEVSVITDEFIVKFNSFKKRILFLRSCLFFYGTVIIAVGVTLFLRVNISAFTIFSVVSLGILVVGFCLQSKLSPAKKIPLLLPISPATFVHIKRTSLTRLEQDFPVFNGYDFLHPATFELLHRNYNKNKGLNIAKLLKAVKQQSEIAAFISSYVPIETYIPVKKIPELLASSFVLAAYGQFSSIYPEHILVASIKAKVSYRFYLAALLSVFENTFTYNGKKYVITKPLLSGIQQILATKNKIKIFQIKGPKYVGKTALVYLFANFFYDKKFSCKPKFEVIANKKRFDTLTGHLFKPRVILIDKSLKANIDYSKLLRLRNSLIFIECAQKIQGIKKHIKTIQLVSPDIYDLYKLAIFWDLNNLFDTHYRIDELFTIVERSQIKHLETPQPIRLYRFLTGEFS